jgi:REP element-mobilizing transposase RayT
LDAYPKKASARGIAKMPASKRPVVIAHHLVWTVYGTWLPNDPRGSGSQYVATEVLAELGPLHYGRKRNQPHPHAVREFYDRAEPRLVFPVIRFDSKQIEIVAAALGEVIQKERYTCFAAAVLPDHVHLVIRKHRDRAETMIETLQESTRLRLSTCDFIPPDHPVWTKGGYKRFLDSPEAVRTVIRYVENNPVKSALPPQRWPFVTPYNGWPFGPKPR